MKNPLKGIKGPKIGNPFKKIKGPKLGNPFKKNPLKKKNPQNPKNQKWEICTKIPKTNSM